MPSSLSARSAGSGKGSGRGLKPIETYSGPACTGAVRRPRRAPRPRNRSGSASPQARAHPRRRASGSVATLKT
ncbi:hypothetical protein GCM10010266_04480 [Streptomyces griseomycini]|nr:hypothetical protein GCM10010266_04480 [Streptomyces griseomycini]